MKLGKITIEFKPVFGNETHIRILNLYNQVVKDKKLLAEKLKAAKDSKTLRETIKQNENQIKKILKIKIED